MKPLDEEENPNVEPAPQDWDAAVDIKDLHKVCLSHLITTKYFAYSRGVLTLLMLW